MMNTVKDLRIETERLLIKPYKEEDLEECFKLMQNKDLFKYLDMDVMSHEDYEGLFRWLIDCYETSFDKNTKEKIMLKKPPLHYLNMPLMWWE